MKETILNVENLSVSYDNHNIIDDISFNLDEKGIYAVLCPNNCGKTTLIKAISGIIRSNRGKISVNNIILSKENLNKYILEISTVLEDIEEQFITENVKDELMFPLINLGYSKDKISKAIKEVSKVVKVTSLLDKPIDDLTYFEKVKVILAASLVHKPKLLLIDDIFRSLDEDEKEELHKILKKINEELEVTILYTTSDISDIINLDQVILLYEGKIECQDSYQNIIMRDNELSKMGFKVPLMIDLSRKLQFYNLVDKIYYDEDEVIDKLWK